MDLNKLRIALFMFYAFSQLACGKAFHANPVQSEEQSSLSGQVLTIDSPREGSPSKNSLTLAGTCVTGVKVSISGDITQIAPLSCTDGKFQASVSFNPPDGTKNIVISQTLPAGTLTDTQHYILDSSAPLLELVTPLNNANVKDSVVLQGACETGIDVTVVGSTTYALPCTNNMFATTMPLSDVDGTINLVLSQTDAAGNSSSVNLALKKDTVAPIINITLPASGSSVSASTVSIGGTCETGLMVDVSGAGVTAPVNTLCQNNAFNLTVVLTAGAGNKIVQASQTDAAGNSVSTSTTLNFSPPVDAPAIAFSSPAANSLFKNTLSVGGTCQSGLTVAFSGSGWSAPANTSCTNGTFSATVTFTSGDGAKNLIASQTNSSSVTGSTSRTFIRDATPPSLTIASPVAGTSSKTGVNLMGACETGLAVSISGGVTTPTNVACVNSAFASQITFSSGDGNKTIQVSQSDAAGNASSASRSFTRDTMAPAVAITSPAANTSAVSQITISGSCEGTLMVTASGSGVASPVSKACSNSQFSLTVSFTNGDGTKTVQVAQTDAAGNVGTDNRNFTRMSEPASLDGVALYTQNCAGCHNAIATSAKLGRTAAQITTALSNITAMSTIRLTAAQVDAIAAALVIENPQSCLTQADPGHVPLHRINKEEYTNVVNSLLGITGKPGDVLPDENTAFGFNNIAALLTISPTSIERYLTAAENAVGQAFTTNAAGIFKCDGKSVTPSAVTRACAEQILTRMTESAFRRPATAAELTQAKSFLDQAVNEGQALQEGVRWGLQWMLVTPSFLYRVVKHPAPNDPKTIKSLDGYELANRLSFFLWSSKPDQALLDAAANGTLVQTSVLESQVARMLADPKAQALVNGFAKQWLELHKFEQHSVDTQFYAFSETLRTDMLTETNLLLKDVFGGDQSPLKLLTSDSAYLNRRLATHYGVSGPTSDTTFVKTSVANTQRRGLLGQGSVLTLTSVANRTSIVRRGKWILDNILCEPPGDPPSNVNIGGLDGTTEQSIRDRLAAHRADPTCASCHNKIDPPGFTLENFDPVGAERTRYRDGSAIDTSGVLPDGKSVSGALDLSTILKADPRYRVCVSKKLMTYALGRGVENKDQCTINRFANENVSENLPLSSLVKAIVTSDPFRKQTGGQ